MIRRTRPLPVYRFCYGSTAPERGLDGRPVGSRPPLHKSGNGKSYPQLWIFTASGTSAKVSAAWPANPFINPRAWCGSSLSDQALERFAYIREVGA
jgi:hypothetical protein